MTDLALAGNTSLAASYDYGADAGVGFEKTTADDLSLPFLNVLQALSPQVSGGPGERVAGATAGGMMNTVTGEVYPDSGIIIQPVAANHVFVEWKPRNSGGGFVGVLDQNDPIVVAAKAASKDYGKYKSPAGNDLVETIYLFALVHRTANIADQVANGVGEPIIITFQSTKLKAFKNFNYRMFTIPKKPPLFAHRILVKTVSEKNAKGQFYNFDLTGVVENNIEKSLIPPTLDGQPHPMLVAGRKFKLALDNGALKVNYAKSNTAGEGGGNAGADDDIPF